MKRFAVFLLLALAPVIANAQQLLIVKAAENVNLAIKMQADGTTEFLGVYQSVVVVGDTPTPPPPDEPTGPGQLICIRPWSCTLEESDADLTIRESIDAANSDVPYIRVLPGTVDQRMQLHATVEKYRALVPDPEQAWVFHVVPTQGKPRIAHQGPLDAATVLGWVNIQQVAFAADAQPDEKQWLDIDFGAQADDGRLGMLEEPQWRKRFRAATAINVRNLPGFKPIPKSEWSRWTSTFPVARRAKSIRHISEQVMGSCVGHSCGNSVEGAGYHMAGDRFFRKLSFMSMYSRIGRSPNSGAYVGDAADEIYSRGILPATNARDIAGLPYPHSHRITGGFYDDLPRGWEATAAMWKALVYEVTDEESAFRILMDCRLRTQFGRSRHAISGFAVTQRNNWAYENSWGTDWGDLGKSVGYDRRFYDSYTYHPVLRDEIDILEAAELSQESPLMASAESTTRLPSAHLEAYKHFDKLLQEQAAKLDEVVEAIRARDKANEYLKELKPWVDGVDRELRKQGIIADE